MIIDGKIEVFLATAEHGSMSRAAKELYVSQPSLSAQIRKLETEIGFDLFDRSPQGVTLTKAGELFRDDMLRMKHIYERSIARGRSAVETGSLTLAIGLLGTRETVHIEAALVALHDEHPEVEIQFKMIPHCFDKRKQMLIDGAIDCFIHGCKPDTQLGYMKFFPLFSTRECLAMSPSHELAKLSIISRGDLAGRTILMPEEGASVPSGRLRRELEEFNPGLVVETVAIDPGFVSSLPYLPHPLASLEKIMKAVPGVVTVPLDVTAPIVEFGIYYLPDRNKAMDYFLHQLSTEK